MKSLDTREQQLQAFFTALGDAAQAGNRAAYEGLFTPTAALFAPHRPPLLGRAQIGNWFDQFREGFVLVLDSYANESVDIVGDVALVRSHGVGHYLVKATGEQVPFDQKYLDVLRYDKGAWQLAYHVASSTTFEPGIWERAWERE